MRDLRRQHSNLEKLTVSKFYSFAVEETLCQYRKNPRELPLNLSNFVNYRHHEEDNDGG